MPQLATEGIRILSHDELDNDQRDTARPLFPRPSISDPHPHGYRP